MQINGEVDIEDALKTYYRARLVHDLFGEAQRRFMPSKMQELEEDEKRLSIAHKKRLLGMPLSDEDYELATNEGFSFKQPATNLLGYFGKKGSDALPALRHFSRSGLPKMIGDGLLKGTRYGRTASAAGRIFRQYG